MGGDEAQRDGQSRHDEALEREVGLQRGEVMADAEEAARAERTEQPPAEPATDVEGFEEVNPDPGWTSPPAGHREGDRATDDDVRRKG